MFQGNMQNYGNPAANPLTMRHWDPPEEPDHMAGADHPPTEDKDVDVIGLLAAVAAVITIGKALL